MKRLFLCLALFSLFVAAPASAMTYQFQQRVVPLECTQSTVTNGVTTTTYLSPQQCNDLLHPQPPHNNGRGSQTTQPASPTAPLAPDTGFYREPMIGFSQFLLVALVGWLIVYYARHRTRRLSKRRAFGIVRSRVSSFRTRRTK